jgi:hypothetical protein
VQWAVRAYTLGGLLESLARRLPLKTVVDSLFLFFVCASASS